MSEGVLAAVMQQAGARIVKDLRRQEHVLENVTVYYLRTVPIDAMVTIRPLVIEASRRFVKLEVQALYEDELVAKAMMTAQTIDPG